MVPSRACRDCLYLIVRIFKDLLFVVVEWSQVSKV